MRQSRPLRPTGSVRMSKTFVDWTTLDYSGFAKLARDDTLSPYEKIGFPDHYRQGYEEAIFADIRAKLPRLDERELVVMDIGPGCSDLARMIVDHCRAQGHRLVLIDSPEMLEHLPDAPFVEKRPGLFPKCRDALSDLAQRVDVMISYSVLHYVFIDANPFDFVDVSLQLLAPGGEFLIGDIPNVSKRRRFFSSKAGIEFHRRFTQTDTLPQLACNQPLPRLIDDSVMLALDRAGARGWQRRLSLAPTALSSHEQPAGRHLNPQAMIATLIPKNRKLVIVGDSAFAEIAYEYFTHDSPYEVVAFAVEQAHLKRSELFGLPVVAFETIDGALSARDARCLCRNHLHPAQSLAHAPRTDGKGDGLCARELYQSPRLYLAQRQVGGALLHLRE